MVENRSERSLIAYKWPHKERFAAYAFELAPGEAQTYGTQMGQRFRLYDTNSGEILHEVIIVQGRQVLRIEN